MNQDITETRTRTRSKGIRGQYGHTLPHTHTHTHTHTRTRTLKVSQMQNFILHFNVNHGLDTLEAVGQQRNVAPLT